MRAPLSLLLGSFGAVSFGALLLLITLATPKGEEIRHAYGPADFPTVFAAPITSDGSPILDKETFPCSQCHDGKDLKPNPEPREHLRDPHESRQVKHGNLWCLACHGQTDYDTLHLANGDRVALTDSVRLCAQCHGDKAKDWTNGAHGKRTGRWDGGPKQIFACVACHDPHAPRFKQIDALPPPVKPDFTHDFTHEVKK